MLIKNEFYYMLRQPLIWLCIILPLLFSWGLSSGIAAMDNDHLKQLQLNFIASMMMILPILIAVMCPISFLRDQESNMQALIEVTKTTRVTRNLARFVSCYGLSVLICFLVFFVIVSCYYLQLTTQVNVIYLMFKHTAVLMLPNVLLLCAIGFWVGQLTQNAIANYVLFTVIWIGYLVLASMAGNPILAGSSMINDSFYRLFLWLDPFAYTAVIDGLTNTTEHSSMSLVFNRITVLLFAVTFVYTGLKYQLNRADNTAKKIQPIPIEADQDMTQSTLNLPIAYQPYCVRHLSRLTVCKGLFKQAITSLFTDKVTIILLLLWPALVFNTVVSSSGYSEVFATMEYTSMDAINHFAFDLLPLMGCFFMLLWSWQLCTRDKRLNMAEMIASTPIKNSDMLLSHLAIMCVMTSLLLLLSFLGSSAAQYFTGSGYQVLPYIKALMLQGLPILLFAWISVSVFHLCRSQKMATVIMATVLLVKFTPVTRALNLPHNFWNIASAPLQAPDAFWGYRESISTYFPYMSTWLIAVLSLCTLACVFSYRCAGIGRIKSHKKHYWLMLPLCASGLSFMVLHHQLVAENPLTNSHKREMFKVQYEQQFSDWKNRPQPVISHIDAQVDFFTEQNIAQFKMTYTLSNQTQSAIKHILVGRAGFYGWAETKVLHGKMVSFSQQLKQARFEFNEAMQPGETRTLKTQFIFKQPVHWPVRGHHYVTPQFSYIRSIALLPTVGYQTNFELSNRPLRASYGLKLREQKSPSALFSDKNTRVGQYNWLTLTSTITTDNTQVALSQGKLVSKRKRKDRNEFVYKTYGAMRAIPAWLSMPFNATTKQHEGVTLQVFAKNQADPKRRDAVQLHLKAMQDTLSWFNTHISPYQAKQMSLINATNVGATGYALPQIMLIGDRVGFRASPSDDAQFDQRYRRTVHETAHQWFGHSIGNGVHQDSAFLIESMAKYVELVMLERHYGKSAMNALVDYERLRYEQGVRDQLTPAVSLVDATQSHDQYSRATLAFAELRETLGDEVITHALRKVWKGYSYPNKPANSMDFVRELKVSAGEKYIPLIERLLLQPDIRGH